MIECIWIACVSGSQALSIQWAKPNTEFSRIPANLGMLSSVLVGISPLWEEKREICYASHIDRCIYQYYNHLLDEMYIKRVHEIDISDSVVAYRSDLKKNNIHFSHDAFSFIKKMRRAISWLAISQTSSIIWITSISSNNFVNYLGYANCLMTIMQSIRVLQNIANGI